MASNSLERSCAGDDCWSLLATWRPKIPTGRPKTDGMALIGRRALYSYGRRCVCHFCFQHPGIIPYSWSHEYPFLSGCRGWAIWRGGAVKVIRSMVGRCRELMAAVTFWERQTGVACGVWMATTVDANSGCLAALKRYRRGSPSWELAWLAWAINYNARQRSATPLKTHQFGPLSARNSSEGRFWEPQCQRHYLHCIRIVACCVWK